MKFPTKRHNEVPQVPEDFSWDPNVHLQMESPTFVKTLDFETLSYPSESEYEIAYSAPFRVVSPEGEAKLRQVIDSHRGNVKSNIRLQGTLRGLTPMSKFVEDFIHDETFLAKVSELAGEPLCPSTNSQHAVQVNFGKPGNASQVDKWHFDSVDYVLVIILSDMEDMVGGKLEVLEKSLGGKEATLKLAEAGIPQEFVRQQTYEHSGYGIFAQGSKVLHRVTPVLEAKEDRISFIISFARTDVFGEDNNRTVRFCNDPEEIIAWDFARHEAWRQSGVLKYLIEESDPNTMNADDFSSMLDHSAARLERAARIIRNEEDDDIGHIEDKIPDPEKIVLPEANSSGEKSWFTGMYGLLINFSDL